MDYFCRMDNHRKALLVSLVYPVTDSSNFLRLVRSIFHPDPTNSNIYMILVYPLRILLLSSFHSFLCLLKSYFYNFLRLPLVWAKAFVVLIAKGYGGTFFAPPHIFAINVFESNSSSTPLITLGTLQPVPGRYS